jgi:hypothetical protein
MKPIFQCPSKEIAKNGDRSRGKFRAINGIRFVAGKFRVADECEGQTYSEATSFSDARICWPSSCNAM